jgi:agmatinase
LRLPLIADQKPVPEVDVLLCGVPFDGGTSFRPGARFGPRGVREASALARGFSAALGVDIYEELKVADGGDIVIPPQDLGLALETIAERADSIVRSGAIGGFVGGDQTITLGVLRGIQRAKLRSVGLLHIDSHSNTAPPLWGHKIHHGSAIRVAVEEGLVRADRVLQIGIRGPYTSGDDLQFAMSSGFEIVNVDEVRWDLHSAVSQLRRFVGQGPTYVSVDISALDPCYAPGTGIPSPGGMTSWELQQILRALVGADIAGFDVVEIAPPYDVGDMTSLLGVTVLQEILSALADTRRSARPAPSSAGTRSRRGRRLSP